MASDALVTRGLSRRYGSRWAVKNLDLQVQEGDVYGFLGPNGAGKTTAIRCMLGLISKTEGEVEIFGEKDPVKQRATVGAMVETPAFHKWMSGKQNLQRGVAFAGRGGPAEIDRALELVGLKGRENEKVRGYSLGMRQRLGIARALVGKPKMLILDEPTNGLDPRGMKEIRDLLSELARREKLTIFISSHLLSEIELLCARVGIIEHGKLIAEGNVDELVAGKSNVAEVDVGVDDAAALDRLIQSTDGLSLVGEGEDDRVRVALEGGLTVPELNRLLTGANLDVSALVPVTKSLEDLFLALTSKELT